MTGASRGLGLLLARELGARGHDLVICARSDEGLEAARDELAATGAPNPPSRRGCAR
ncbi:MAG TPA: SDR family NAD(P)-dependent oxidoreductase [Pseudonocardiaceae bacterium]|nr:SDR family NAD(P)-dependent oxidoreductase [Pseudonocardiaceae bacterium]